MLRMTRRQVLARIDREKVVQLRGRILIPRTELARLLWSDAPALQH